MVNVNGMAHIQLNVSNMRRSAPFYKKLLNAMSLQTIVDSNDYLYCVGGRTGLAISPVPDEFKNEPFQQRRVGLHHVCFRARSREDVDAIYEIAREVNAKIIHPPEEGSFAPGYYSVLFEDPDGIRIEANYVPGKGHLDADRELPLKARGVY